MISIEVSPKNIPLQTSKSQNMFETKTYVRKQQYKKMTALLEKEEAEILEKQTAFVTKKATYKSN